METNPEIVMKLKTKLNEWFNEAKAMEAIIYPPVDKNSPPIPRTSSKLDSDRISQENENPNIYPKSPNNTRLTKSKSKSFDHSISPT